MTPTPARLRVAAAIAYNAAVARSSRTRGTSVLAESATYTKERGGVDDMRTLRDLYAHHAWADAQVFSACQLVDHAQLEADAPGTYGTLDETLKHMVQVEDVYLRMLRSEVLEQSGPPDAYFAHDLAWFQARAAQLASGYMDLLATAQPAFYDEPLKVPWFDFALTKHDGLLQVLSHSAQHRAQVLSVLGQHGVEVPNVDYVFFVESGNAPAR